MTVEIDYYSFKNKGGDKTFGPDSSEVIVRGTSKKVRHLEPAEFRVFNSDNVRCVINPEYTNNKTTGMRYKDETDRDGFMILERGVRLNLAEPVAMIKGERIVLSKKAKRSTREVHLYFDDDDDFTEDLNPVEPELVSV